jgi:DHA1 family inner membrane transport protein
VLFGIGMTVGNLIGARFADRALMRTVCVALIGEIAVAIGFYFGAHDKVVSAVLILLFPGFALAVVPGLQSRIIKLAGGAPNLAVASIQAAFNVSNTIGAWLGGLAIAGGIGYNSPNLIAAGLAVAGLVIAGFSARQAVLPRKAGALPVGAEPLHE